MSHDFGDTARVFSLLCLRLGCVLLVSSVGDRREPLTWEKKGAGTGIRTRNRPITSRFSGVRRRGSVPASRLDTPPSARRSLPLTAVVAVTAAVSEQPLLLLPRTPPTANLTRRG